MRSKFLLGLVVMLLMAVPAMAAPLSIDFWGAANGTVNGVGYDGQFAIQMMVDTTDLLSGTYVGPGGTANIPVLYYAGAAATRPGISGATFSYIDPIGGLTTGTITDVLYVAYATNAWPGSVGLGLWDPTLINDPSLPQVGDVINALAPTHYDMISPLGIETDVAFLSGLAFNTSLGVVTLDQLSIVTNQTLDILGQPIVDTGYATLKYSFGGAPTHFMPLPTPEPSMILLFGAGLLGLGVFRKKM